MQNFKARGQTVIVFIKRIKFSKLLLQFTKHTYGKVS